MFDPMNGNVLEPSQLNNENRLTLEAIEYSIAAITELAALKEKYQLDLPEAELALRRTKAVFTCVCKLCEEKTCGDCIVRIGDESVKNCLAKLEGGGGE